MTRSPLREGTSGGERLMADLDNVADKRPRGDDGSGSDSD